MMFSFVFERLKKRGAPSAHHVAGAPQVRSYQTMLGKHLPPAALPPTLELLALAPELRLTVSRPRKTKLGDYRPPRPHSGGAHHITINSDLNRYAFLVTLLHEIAHYHTFVRHGNVPAHGIAWKNQFRALLQPFLTPEMFPSDVLLALQKYAKNIKASSCTDQNLLRSLNAHNPKSELGSHLKTVESLPENALFMAQNGKIYVKKEKIRTRFLCIEQKTHQKATVHPLMLVAEAQK